MKFRIAAASFALTLTAAAAVIAAPGHAHSATLFQDYEGTGWNIADGNGVRYLDANPWKIVFYDTTARTKLTPYANLTAAHIKAHTGLTVTVTTTVTKGTTTCPPSHTIIMRLTSTVTRSAASQCHTATGAADGSRATFALGNWTNVTLSGSHEIYRRKVVSHELGHSFGLSHPNTWTTNPSPLMRGDIWGGYKSITYADDYTNQDITGFKNLVANRNKVPPPTTAAQESTQ